MRQTAATAGAPAYLKVSEVAERLNLSLRQVYDLIATRELGSARFGKGRGGIRVTAESLAAFENARRREPAAP